MIALAQSRAPFYRATVCVVVAGPAIGVASFFLKPGAAVSADHARRIVAGMLADLGIGAISIQVEARPC